MSGPLPFLLDLLFPPRCVFCGGLLHLGENGGICTACQRGLPWLLEEEAEQTGEFFSLCVSPLRYQGVVRDSIRRYKFKGIRGYGRVYGKLVAQCVRDHLKEDCSLVTWVPLSEKRLRERGYDQAFLLAATAALHMDTVAVETLCKARHTQAQSGLTEEERRRANVLGAYEITDSALVDGKRVLLIDDVITTGSTLSECARVLRTAGADEVVCATLARAR